MDEETQEGGVAAGCPALRHRAWGGFQNLFFVLFCFSVTANCKQSLYYCSMAKAGGLSEEALPVTALEAHGSADAPSALVSTAAHSRLSPY